MKHAAESPNQAAASEALAPGAPSRPVRRSKGRAPAATAPDGAELLAASERLRLEAMQLSSRAHRSSLGQFFTPLATAKLMAGMFRELPEEVRLLDPGAGVGSLTAAWVAAVCARKRRPRRIAITAFEIDPLLVPLLRQNLEACAAHCEAAGVECSFEVRQEDFLEAASVALAPDLFRQDRLRFEAAILNPPYKKFRSESHPRRLLRAAGVETSNLYSAFLALVLALLERGGQVVSITPRSFCNGPYFRPFRETLLRETNLLRVHVFGSRTHAFRDDDVLQENVILHAVRGEPQGATVTIAQSPTPEDSAPSLHELPFDRVVRPDDPQRFLHLVPDADGRELAESMGQLPCTLADLGLEASTGRVVDFRARALLCDAPGPGTVPLVYPLHFAEGRVRWPRLEARKPNAILAEAEQAGLLVPAGIYVLVRRFSSKEERRRVVAALFDPADVPCTRVGFENHLNYFHARGEPLDGDLARGLAAFLNSSRVDTLFRQFNGHTQVNATDLRALRYPRRTTLVALGRSVGPKRPEPAALDSLVDSALAADLPR